MNSDTERVIHITTILRTECFMRKALFCESTPSFHKNKGSAKSDRKRLYDLQLYIVATFILNLPAFNDFLSQEFMSKEYMNLKFKKTPNFLNLRFCRMKCDDFSEFQSRDI